MANKTFQGRIVQKHDTKANWDKATNFWKVKIPTESSRLSPLGNGFNLFDYTGNKKTNIKKEPF